MRTQTGAPMVEPLPISPNSADRASRPADVGVRIEALAHSFGELAVIESLDLKVAPRQVLGVVGPSGCGKSTLLELISGLREPSRGSIAVGDAAAAPQRLSRCVYMPQRDLLLPWLAAIDNAALPLRVHGQARGPSRAAAAPLFTRFGLAGFEDARPSELSGGMRQRVAFLRTLVAGKPVMLLDEPFASLDAITRAEMQEWLAGALAAEPRTVILVTHDVEEALYLSDRVVVLSARPARLVVDLDVPSPRAADRSHAVTSAGFSALRERAMHGLEGMSP
jgi:NitT/TauT family transport system ATP-binding protein